MESSAKAMNIHLIVEAVFNFLPNQDLMNCCSVSPLWSTMALRTLRKKRNCSDRIETTTRTKTQLLLEALWRRLDPFMQVVLRNSTGLQQIFGVVREKMQKITTPLSQRFDSCVESLTETLYPDISAFHWINIH